MSSHVWSLDDLGEGGDGEAAASPTPSVGATLSANGVLSMGDLGAHCSALLCSAVRPPDPFRFDFPAFLVPPAAAVRLQRTRRTARPEAPRTSQSRPGPIR
eukprot:COSAG02_NODE_2322_length_9135_cov_14.916335_2_plen_101_part_00